MEELKPIPKEEVEALQEKKDALDAKLKDAELSMGYDGLRVMMQDVIKGAAFRRIGFEDVSIEELRAYINKRLVDEEDLHLQDSFNNSEFELRYMLEHRDDGHTTCYVLVVNMSDYDEDGKPRDFEKSWIEFRKTGLLVFVNTFLHIFGWSIVFNKRSNDDNLGVYPKRTGANGFSREVYDRAYSRLRNFMADEAENFKSIS